MKIIYSNKSGKNIHSPFIYRLVANVLFSPHPFYAFSEIDTILENRQESQESQLIFRLINHFQFIEILVIGSQDSVLEKVCRMAKSDIQFYYSEIKFVKDEIEENNKYQRLVIVNDSEEILKTHTIPNSSEIWVIRNIGHEKTKEYFKMLKMRSEVKITIQLNQLVIVIFNEIFEKQNYVIKH